MVRGHTWFFTGGRKFLQKIGCGLLCLALFTGSAAIGQDANPNEFSAELTEEEQKQLAITERFFTVLEGNPRRGTALDRIYGHHVEFGTLDDFMAMLRGRVEKASDDGTGWMLLGLFEAHRGEDAAAIDAFAVAEKSRTDDALASYYLGQSLLLLGQPEKAVEAFERGIERDPQRADLLEIFQQLGRIHQRAHRTEEALKTWQRLEALFPDDPRVQEQIAVVLVEEGEYGLALPRYEQLANLVDDDYRRTMFRIEAAELKIRENRRPDGIADFEALLADLNPESWLYRDVRRRIEEVFLRSGDQDGLVGYYEKWLESHPQDVDGMARLARFLASSARVPEATKWMEKALKLAPTRTELRKAFIDQLVDDQRYSEAIEQYKLLVESAPGNPDFLRDWGKLVAKNKDLSKEIREVEAARIWRQIMAARPDDALTTVQVADLFRHANMKGRALELYQKAVEQAPNDPQYREYLGEFYHILKRPQDALTAWTAIAEGERHTAVNVARLAEVYNSFGYLDEAIEQIAEACRLDSKDFALHLKAAEYHSRTSKYDEALGFIAIAEKLAADGEEQDAVITQRIEVFRSSRRLDDEIDALSLAVHENKNAPADQWHLLARYCAADSRWADATEAVNRALEKDVKSIPALTTAAKIAELSGDYARAAEMNRQLAAIDRRSRGDHLMNVARLEAQLGRADEALQAGRDLIVSAPGNTDNYEFHASLCLQLGKSDEGIDVLRKAVRINPTEPHLIMGLGAALSQQFRTDEAIEVYWRAFEKTDDLDDRTSLTEKLTNLYLQVNQFDKLLERLGRERREEDKRREMTICLAQAHHTSGDYGTARQELESLLSVDTHDTHLLQQLSKLCQEGSDSDGAIEYQRQLVAIAPGHETEHRLATLLQSRGEWDEASEILLKLMQREEDPVRRLRSIDSLLTQGAYENVVAITEPLLSEQRDAWELLYREAVAWASLEKNEEARDRCERLLALSTAHDEMGAVAADRFKQAQAKSRSNNLRGIHSQMPTRPSPFTRLSMSSQIRQAIGLDPDRSYYGGSGRQRPVWTPNAYGDARMAAYAWLIKLDEDEEAKSEDAAEEASSLQKRLEELGVAAAKDDADRETLYDWMYVERLRGNQDSILAIARRLAKEGGREEQQFFLSSLTTRSVQAAAQQAPGSGNEKPKREPLSEDDLELMLQCHESLTAKNESKSTAAFMGGQIIYASNGQAYVQVGGSWTPVAGLMRGGVYLSGIIEELKLAGREEQAAQLAQKQIDSAETSQELVGVMSMLLKDEEYDRLDKYLAKWVEAAHNDIAKGPTATTHSSRSASSIADTLTPAANLLMTWMGNLGPEEEHAKILSLLDHSLDLGTEIAREKRAERSRRRRPTSSTAQRHSTYYQLKYGKENIQVQLDYPRPNDYVSSTTLMLLREVYEVFQRNDVADDLPAHLEKRLQAAPKSNKLYATLMLAYVRWWLEEKDDALALLSQAGTALRHDPTFLLEIATLHQSMGDLDTALEIVDSIVPRDQKLVEQRELMALQLAERLGDIERARQSAERLFGLRLKNETQLTLVEPMRRLGMHEMAEAVVSRVQRRAGSSLTSMGTLMALHQGQGKVELAQQMAHTILRRTKSPLSAMAGSNRNPLRYSSNRSETQLRTQALRLLQQTGVLKDLIARLEDQIQRSPNSPRLYEQLIEYYEATGDRDKVGELLAQAVAARPDSVAFRFQYAKNLESSGKHAEACDQYLEIMKQKPQWITDDMYSVRRVFERAKRSVDLIKTIEKMNVKSFSQPYYIIDLLSDLMRNSGKEENKEELELALNLCEKVFDAFPQYRNQLISRMYDQNLWKNDRVFALGKRAILPSVQEAAATPWFGLNDIYSYSSGGRVNTQFSQMLKGVHGSDKLPELKKVIKERLEEAPDWRGGEAMLALIDLKEDRKDQAKKRLEALVSDEEVSKTIPSDSCWIIGQELDQFEDTRPVALKLFESAADRSSSRSQIQYSPVARLIELYGKLGRKQDARNLLNKQVRKPSSNNYDPQYASYLQVQNSIWAGEQFMKLECPVDAVRVFRRLSEDRVAVEQAGVRYGNRPEYFQSKIDRGLQGAIAALEKVDADEAMAQLLTVPDDLASGTAALDLMLMVPHIADLRAEPMQSPLVELLATISKEDAIKDGVRKRLAALRVEYPVDLSIGIAESAYLTRIQHEDRDEALEALLAAVTAAPLEELKPGRRPNSRQRRTALTQVPLWLIARECLKSAEQQEIGRALGSRALAAARRQSEDQHAAVILYDWGKIALEADDRTQAEAKWSELLDIVTRRPERKKVPAGQKTGATRPPARLPRKSTVTLVANPKPEEKSAAKSQRIPPLTISQFRLAMEIAMAAAENGMPELSRKAVRVSMRGGIPVADLASAPAPRPGYTVPALSPSPASSGTDSGISKNEAEVTESLRKVIGKWNSDEYPAPEVYDLLVPVVFPENRPGEILIYADSSKLQDGQIDSLGAVLVDYAQQAKRLDDLRARIDACKQAPQAKVAALVLKVRVAIARDQLDDAKIALTELAEVVGKGILPTKVQLACHAALPASYHEPLEEPAYAILQAALKLQLQNATTNRDGDGELTLGYLLSRVNRYLADDSEEVKKFFEDYLASRQAYYSRYSGTYGQYLQWTDWAKIAEQAAKAGVTSVAMDYVGRVVDYSYEDRTRPATATALAVVCRDMNQLPPEKRYEAWRDWTLPVEGRQTVRLAAEWVEPVRIPKRFLDTAAFQGRHHTGDVLSNFTELLTSAQECGRLEELREQVKAAYDEKLENASFLYALLLIQLDDRETGKQVVTPIIETVNSRLKRQPGKPRADEWPDYLVYRACLRSPQFASLYRHKTNAFLSPLRERGKMQTLARLYVDLALSTSGRQDRSIRPGDDPQLAHWFPATTRECVTEAGDPWWVIQEGHIAHLTGPGSDLLYFAYPLTGEFEFTVDAFGGAWAETDVGYNGVIVEGQDGSRAKVWSVGAHESFYSGSTLRREKESFGTVKIKVAGGKMQYILNNHVCHEEELTGTSPWITLYTDYMRPTTFRNPRFTGVPTIPREVLLVNGNRMDGWNCSFTGDAQPRHRLMAQKPKSENDSIARYQRDEPKEFGWRAQDGLLLGRAEDIFPSAQSWIYYHRPLRNRESFSYDFYYVPGKSVAHPTIGRIALLLEPQGVEEHWITQISWDDIVFGMDESNRVRVDQAQRGSEKLPLKADAWNQVVLTLAGDTIQVMLNDQLVYERPLEPEVDHRFGLFRRKVQSAKVRQPKLTGPWPEALTPEVRDNLLASTKTYTQADRRLINNILSERFFWPDIPSLVAQSRELPSEQAYEKLRAWVLPSPDHFSLRVYCEFANRENAGQDILCPAFELVAVADRIGKLAELEKAIDDFHLSQELAKRAQTALRALVAMQRRDFDVAKQRMVELSEYAKRGFKKEMGLRERSSELIVAWQAAKHPELRFAAYDLMNELRRKDRVSKFAAKNRTWAKWVDSLAGHIDRMTFGDSLLRASDRALTQWTTVPYNKPSLRAAGYDHTDWLYMPGAVQHIAGGTWGQLFFQSPLKGNFEIVAERSLHSHRETTIAYGMHGAEPRYDYKAKRIATVMHGSRDVDGEIELPRRGQWLADFRIVVNDNKVTTFVNDLELHQETLSSQPAPWLVLQTHDPGYTGTVRNLRILGTPEIPDEIDLIDTGWPAWRADIYGERFSTDSNDENAPWKKVGEEIHGQIREGVAAQSVQSLMMYQRPMLEDGVIEFESYYIPDEFEVHPAVGRTALIVNQDGVQKHILTDAQYDTRLASDNLSPIEGAAEAVELKEEQWNLYRLSLQGDQLTLAVNGVDVATAVVTEPANQRYFGLFRYSDKTKCRVRNLVYRGEWPKTLPAVADQQLARSAELGSGWSEPTVFDFHRPTGDLQAAGLKFSGHAEAFVQTDRGLRLRLEPAGGQNWRPRIRLPKQIEEDCVITLDFEDLRMTPSETGWGSLFTLRADADGFRVGAGLGMDLTGKIDLRSTRKHAKHSGGDQVEARHLPSTIDRGRFRVVRTGPIFATYYAEVGSDDFRLLEMHAMKDAPVRDVVVDCVASDAAATMSVVIKQLSIQTRSAAGTRAGGQ